MSDSALPKRFYKSADIEERDGHYFLLLDNSVTYTPKFIPLSVPQRDVALRLAHEWRLQENVIDHKTMPLTRLLNVALDAVATDIESVRADILKYAQSDLICYRAQTPNELIAEQNKVWGHICKWVEITLQTRLIIAQGIQYSSQLPEFKQKLSKVLDGISSPLTLSALHLMTTLSGSALISWAVYANFLSADEGWKAAHVDELYQERVWGKDDEAFKRRELRWKDFEAAAFAASNMRIKG
jgi:chaperone required for assembly of F1-ATPase